MAIDIDRFRVREGETLDLSKMPTLVEPVYDSKKAYKGMLKRNVNRLRKRQYELFASDTQALLIVFQGMDASGKDGAIRHAMSGINPQGCQVFSFKHPSEKEIDHDFLWRTSQCLPERGHIGIFNRSYYEEVLIVRVHPEILIAERLPGDPMDDGHIWEDRYRSIRDHEHHLRQSGTTVVKFFLHISKEEQGKRFLDRIDEPEKNWKFSLSDAREREFWSDYMNAYEQALAATSTKHAPWYVVPADDKRNARLFVSQIICETLAAMNIGLPEVSDERRSELEVIREQLVGAPAAAPVL